MKVRLIMILLITQVACGLQPTPTPLPGWYNDARELFLEESAFPPGWQIELQLETDTHPRANHVHREFSKLPNSGGVSQDIWRAYTVADAEEKYVELRQSQFQPRLPPEEMVAPWEPPDEIAFQSTIADEYYLACGWEEWAYCQYLARYRNYVTYLRLDRQAEMGERQSQGLTYAEIEAVLKAVDARFGEALDDLPNHLKRRTVGTGVYSWFLFPNFIGCRLNNCVAVTTTGSVITR